MVHTCHPVPCLGDALDRHQSLKWLDDPTFSTLGMKLWKGQETLVILVYLKATNWLPCILVLIYYGVSCPIFQLKTFQLGSLQPRYNLDRIIEVEHKEDLRAK